MELDKRIMSNYKIYTCFDIEEAKEYIGKQGYFADNIEEFNKLVNCPYDMLKNVYDNTDSSPFSFMSFCEHHDHNYVNSNIFKFFLPAEFVNLTKPKEKKYRPFTLDEFLDVFHIGQPITFRNKEYKFKKVLIFNGYETLSNGNAVIDMGTTVYTPQELFDVFELQKPNKEEWQPFGVEE